MPQAFHERNVLDGQEVKIGDVVQPNKSFYHRPLCRVMKIGYCRLFGPWFEAMYPGKASCRQYMSDGRFRFQRPE